MKKPRRDPAPLQPMMPPGLASHQTGSNGRSCGADRFGNLIHGEADLQAAVHGAEALVAIDKRQALRLVVCQQIAQGIRLTIAAFGLKRGEQALHRQRTRS